MKKIDLNSDVGESFGLYRLDNQNEILSHITSANIACGFHSGDPSVMRETVKKAIEHDVKIGAHPGFQDLVGFGRREMQISPQEAYDSMVYQIGALQGVLSTFNEKMNHVKPHGALYNMAAKDEELADAIAQAVFDISPSLILYGLSESKLALASEKIGLQTAHEIFADRTYQSDGSLTSRKFSNSMIMDTKTSINQVLTLINDGKVHTLQDIDISLRADTVCVHGDSPDALLFVEKIKNALKENNISISALNAWGD